MRVDGLVTLAHLRKSVGSAPQFFQPIIWLRMRRFRIGLETLDETTTDAYALQAQRTRTT
jgi:hypothetical protein